MLSVLWTSKRLELVTAATVHIFAGYHKLHRSPCPVWRLAYTLNTVLATAHNKRESHERKDPTRP